MPHRNDDEPLDREDFEDDDDEPFEREDFATRKAARLRDVKEERRDLLVVGVIGLGMLGGGAVLWWLAVRSLRLGWIDIDQDIIYAAQEPGWFYGLLAFTAAMGLFTAQLGVRMMLHTRREARRTARRARRIARAGTRRR